MYANFVLHWVQDKEAAFKNVYKNLKPGGRFGVTLSLVPKLPDVLLKLLSFCGEDTIRKYRGKVFRAPLTFYGETAKEVGFSVDLQEEMEAVVSFPDMESLMDWWHGTSQGVFKPELSDADALKELKETYKSEFRGNKGTLITTKH